MFRLCSLEKDGKIERLCEGENGRRIEDFDDSEIRK